MYKWKLRRRKSCLTQAELVKAYEGPDFDLADRYGEVRLMHTGISAPCNCISPGFVKSSCMTSAHMFFDFSCPERQAIVYKHVLEQQTCSLLCRLSIQWIVAAHCGHATCSCGCIQQAT